MIQIRYILDQPDVFLQQPQSPARIPFRGFEQASAIIRASTSPVTIGAPAASPALAPDRGQHVPTGLAEPLRDRAHPLAEIPTRSAITSRPGPPHRSCGIQLQQHPGPITIETG